MNFVFGDIVRNSSSKISCSVCAYVSTGFSGLMKLFMQTRCQLGPALCDGSNSWYRDTQTLSLDLDVVLLLLDYE